MPYVARYGSPSSRHQALSMYMFGLNMLSYSLASPIRR